MPPTQDGTMSTSPESDATKRAAFSARVNAALGHPSGAAPGTPKGRLVITADDAAAVSPALAEVAAVVAQARVLRDRIAALLAGHLDGDCACGLCAWADARIGHASAPLADHLLALGYNLARTVETIAADMPSAQTLTEACAQARHPAPRTV
jgi:hypothetical protein